MISSGSLSFLVCVLLSLQAAPLSASIALTQPDGSELLLDAPARSVVTLSPHLAELVFAAGGGSRLAATVAFSEFPPEAADVTRIGDAFRLDIERIVALRPDLVIAWQSGNPQAAVAQLRSLGLAVWSVEIREPEEIPAVIQSIGRAVGTSSSAEEKAAALRHQLAALAARYRDARRVDYFYQVDAKPLFTISGKHLISKGLHMCGGHNVFEDETGLAFQVSHEAVIVANPRVIFAPSQKGGGDPLKTWRAWPGLEAVRNGSLFVLPADEISRATPRFLDALETACALLDGSRKAQQHE